MHVTTEGQKKLKTLRGTKWILAATSFRLNARIQSIEAELLHVNEACDFFFVFYGIFLLPYCYLVN